jgi:ribosome biogenesis protein SSF1/2
MEKVPKSFVMRSGIVGGSVTALVRDVRRILEPNTASHLRVNSLKTTRE